MLLGRPARYRSNDSGGGCDLPTFLAIAPGLARIEKGRTMTQQGRSELPTWRELASDFEREPQSGYLDVLGFEQQRVYLQSSAKSLCYLSSRAGQKLLSTSLQDWPHCIAQNAGSLDTRPIKEPVHAIKDNEKRFYWFVAAVERQKLGHGVKGRVGHGGLKRNEPPDVFRIDDYRQKASEACRMLAAVPIEGNVSKPSRQPAVDDTNGGKTNVNARMLDTIQKNWEARGWTCTKWAKYLKCARSTVVDTPTWKELATARDKLKAERRKDRRRKPKASDQRRD